MRSKMGSKNGVQQLPSLRAATATNKHEKSPLSVSSGSGERAHTLPLHRRFAGRWGIGLGTQNSSKLGPTRPRRPQDAPKRPRTPPGSPRTAPQEARRWCQEASRCLQEASKGFQEAPSGLQDTPRRLREPSPGSPQDLQISYIPQVFVHFLTFPTLSPTTPHDGAKRPQDRPKTAPGRPKNAQDGPRTPSGRPKTAPGRPRNGPGRPRTAPQRAQDAPGGL